ncbi:hypothetical protein MAM1_0265c08933 [Mucor ambiguus]|uniref:Uncharacterized protein n=1 Tax=Mucor ambiguus TaxID=91626 RepID=A0A0C9MFC2_9FUNG|nr:hypothetical protein MAM1_0265c08933 [Mucor ambiguus]
MGETIIKREKKVLIDNLHGDIVNFHDGDSFSEYKREWTRSVLAYAKVKTIDLTRAPKPNWKDISTAAIDKLVSNSYDFKMNS